MAARPIHRLSARTVATLKTPGLHADGAGLYLTVDPSGRKRWTYIFQWEGRRREMGLGSIADVSLAEVATSRRPHGARCEVVKIPSLSGDAPAHLAGPLVT